MREFIEHNQKYDRKNFINYRNYTILPLKKYPKLGYEFSELYLVCNNLTNKLQLWYSDIDEHLLSFVRRDLSCLDYFISKALNEYKTKKLVPFEFDDLNILISYQSKSYKGLLVDDNGKTGFYVFEDDRSYFVKWYDELRYVGYEYLLAKDDEGSCIIDKYGDIVVCFGKSRFISFVNDELFISEYGGVKAVRNLKNEVKLYGEIKNIGYDYLLAENENGSLIVDKHGDPVVRLEDNKFISLANDKLFISEYGGVKSIRNFRDEIVGPIILDVFIKLTDESHYILKKDDKFSIYDFFGHKISEDYDLIRNMNGSYIVAQSGKMYYLLDLSGNNVISSEDFMEVSRGFWSGDV